MQLCGCILLGVCLLWPAGAYVDREEVDFDIVVLEGGPLGVALGADLQIQRFISDSKAEPALTESSGLRIGDRIVRVNGRNVERTRVREFAQLLRDTARPFTLTVRPEDGRPRMIQDHMSPLTKEEALMTNGAHVDVFSGPVKLLSMPATEAEFSGASSCDSKPLTLPQPSNACTRITNKVKGCFVLIRRGDCQFFDKAFNVEQAGAAGVIFVYSDFTAPRIPSPSGEILNISVAMISKKYGQLVEDTIAIQSGVDGLYAKMSLSNKCKDKSGKWHFNKDFQGTSEGNEVIASVPSEEVMNHPDHYVPLYKRMFRPHVTSRGIRYYDEHGKHIPLSEVTGKMATEQTSSKNHISSPRAEL